MRRRPFATPGLLGAAGLVLAALPLLGGWQDFARSYHAALVGLMAVPLGAVALLATARLVNAWWGPVLGAELRALAALLPLFAVLMLPTLLWLPEVYSWVGRPTHALPEVVRHKAAYLNTPFFVARSLAYLALWSVLAVVAARSTPPLADRSRGFAAATALLIAVTGAFAAFDWILALDPKTSFADFGLLFLGGALASAFALAVLVAILRAELHLRGQMLSGRGLLGLGSVLFGLVLVWAYFVLMEWIVAQSGNKPHHAHWFVERVHHGWDLAAWAGPLLHFLAPFLLLLLPPARRRWPVVAAASASVVLGHVVFTLWQTAPAWSGGPGLAPAASATAGLALVAAAALAAGLPRDRAARGRAKEDGEAYGQA